MTSDPLFQRALVTEDEAYLMTERALLEEPEHTEALRQGLGHPDPVARLTANVMLEWAEAEGDPARDHSFTAALRYLDYAERRFARTAAQTPPVQGVVEQLSARFGGQLAELLALRLVKQPRQASWRVLTTLGYLDRHKTPAVTEALIRFAAQTPSPQLQRMTVAVIAGLGDPELRRKLIAERERLAGQGAAMPPALAALGHAPSGMA
jgi:hypothetical protein